MRLRVDSDAFTPSQAARGQWRVESGGEWRGSSAKAPGAGHCFGMFWAIVKKNGRFPHVCPQPDFAERCFAYL